MSDLERREKAALAVLALAVIVFLLPPARGGNLLDHVGVALGFYGFYLLGKARS